VCLRDGLHQNRLARRLPQRAVDLLVARVADQQHGVSAIGVAPCFGMNLAHQRTGRVEDLETTPGSFRPHGR
jgi:hypothetical protein